MTKSSPYTVGSLACVIDATVRGDAALEIDGVAALSTRLPRKIGFYANPHYRQALHDTTLSAVIISPEQLHDCPVTLTALITEDPTIGFAKISQLLNPIRPVEGGIHPTAVIHKEATIASGAVIGPYVVVESYASVGEGAVVGAHTYLGEGTHVGANTRFWPRVTLYAGVQIGKNCSIHSGVVIGSDGFGFAQEGGRWLKIPQVGSVVVGNNVEIGANTTIDRGTLEDTMIGNGVILDNQIQIGHNVHVGDYTAVAGCVGIAGSTHIGKHCMIGGGSKINGHIHIADGVILLGNSQVVQSIEVPGVFASHLGIQPARQWKRILTRLFHLDEIAKRLSKLEKQLEEEG